MSPKRNNEGHSEAGSRKSDQANVRPSASRPEHKDGPAMHRDFHSQRESVRGILPGELGGAGPKGYHEQNAQTAARAWKFEGHGRGL